MIATERAELNDLRIKVNEQAAKILELQEKLEWYDNQLRDRDEFLR